MTENNPPEPGEGHGMTVKDQAIMAGEFLHGLVGDHVHWNNGVQSVAGHITNIFFSVSGVKYFKVVLQVADDEGRIWQPSLDDVNFD